MQPIAPPPRIPRSRLARRPATNMPKSSAKSDSPVKSWLPFGDDAASDNDVTIAATCSGEDSIETGCIEMQLTSSMQNYEETSQWNWNPASFDESVLTGLTPIPPPDDAGKQENTSSQAMPETISNLAPRQFLRSLPNVPRLKIVKRQGIAKKRNPNNNQSSDDNTPGKRIAPRRGRSVPRNRARSSSRVRGTPSRSFSAARKKKTPSRSRSLVRTAAENPSQSLDEERDSTDSYEQEKENRSPESGRDRNREYRSSSQTASVRQNTGSDESHFQEDVIANLNTSRDVSNSQASSGNVCLPRPIHTRNLLATSVYHNQDTGIWITTINMSQKETVNKSNAAKYLKAFSFQTEREARESGKIFDRCFLT